MVYFGVGKRMGRENMRIGFWVYFGVCKGMLDVLVGSRFSFFIEDYYYFVYILWFLMLKERC